MPVPSVGYAQVASTIVQLKAITAANRTGNFCLFLPAIGSWVYYDSTSTATANDTHVFLPNDGVGRWLVTNQLPYFAAANSVANSAIATHNAATNAHPQYQTANQVGNAANSAIATHNADTNAHAQYQTANQVGNAANSAIATHNADTNPHAQYQTADQVGSTANSAIATHNADTNPHAQYQTADQVGSTANSAIATHNADTNPHPQYHRKDGVLIANQPNSATPAYSARIATGNGSNSGGFQVLTPSGSPAVSLGADSANRGVITAGASGLVVGGFPNELLSFYGKTPAVIRPNAIALAGNNTADTRRAANEIIAALRALGVIA